MIRAVSMLLRPERRKTGPRMKLPHEGTASKAFAGAGMVEQCFLLCEEGSQHAGLG